MNFKKIFFVMMAGFSVGAFAHGPYANLADSEVNRIIEDLSNAKGKRKEAVCYELGRAREVIYQMHMRDAFRNCPKQVNNDIFLVFSDRLAISSPSWSEAVRYCFEDGVFGKNISKTIDKMIDAFKEIKTLALSCEAKAADSEKSSH